MLILPRENCPTTDYNYCNNDHDKNLMQINLFINFENKKKRRIFTIEFLRSK